MVLGLHQDQHQVGADAEIGPLVADDQPSIVGGNLLHRRVDHHDDVGADGVFGGMEFEQGHIVTDVDQAGPLVGLDHPVLLLQAIQRKGLGMLLHVTELPADVEVANFSAFLPVEGFGAGCEQLLHEGRNRLPFFTHAGDGLLHADGVPHFEGSQIPVEAPLHRPVDAHDVVGDLRNARR